MTRTRNIAFATLVALAVGPAPAELVEAAPNVYIEIVEAAASDTAFAPSTLARVGGHPRDEALDSRATLIVNLGGGWDPTI